MTNVHVLVDPHNIEGAIRRFKKKVEGTGLLREMHQRTFYESPSRKRRRKSDLARKKARKALKTRAQRDLVYENKPNHFNGDYVPSPNYKGKHT